MVFCCRGVKIVYASVCVREPHTSINYLLILTMFDYKFIGWNRFWYRFKDARILLLSGFLGTGKTLTSVALGYHLLRYGVVDSVCYPFPCAWNSAPQPMATLCGLDEAGRVFDNRISYKDKTLSQMLADSTVFLRKHSSYLVASTYLDSDKRLRKGMRMRRLRTVGNLVWIFQWEMGPEDIDLRDRANHPDWDEGVLIFLRPSAFFGCYDTKYPPTQDELIEFFRCFATTPY